MDVTHLAIALIAAIGVMGVFYGMAQARVASSDLNARLAEYGVLEGGSALPGAQGQGRKRIVGCTQLHSSMR